MTTLDNGRDYTLATLETFALGMKHQAKDATGATLDSEEVERLAILLPDLIKIARAVARTEEHGGEMAQCLFCGLLMSTEPSHTEDCEWDLAQRLKRGGA